MGVKVTEGIGLVLILTGIACADCDRLWIPSIIIAVGLYLMRGVIA